MHSDQTLLSAVTLPASGQRLFDKVMVAFEQSCEQRDAEVAAHLLQAAEALLERPVPRPHVERRKRAERLVAARACLWLLQHPAPTVAQLTSEVGNHREPHPDEHGMAGDPVLKAGRLSAGLSEISCVVMKLSETAAQVRIAVPWATPERLVLRLSDGTSHAARFRWARGLLLGLELTGAARQIQRDFRKTHLAETVNLLRAEQCFWDEALRRAVEEVAAAQARLELALRPYAEVDNA